MPIMQKIRAYHAILAVLSLLAYITGELGIIHSWLGYGVAMVIAFRLLWALSGNPHVGLIRFYPSFEGLNLTNIFTHSSISKIFMLGIALNLIAATTTGIVIDKGRSIGLANTEIVANAHADDNGHHKKSESFYEEALEEVHEFFANFLLLFVGMHVSYLLLFKFPLAKFMLFLNKPRK